MAVTSLNINLREVGFLSVPLCLALILAYHFFGFIGLAALLILGICILALPVLQSIKGSFILLYFVSAIFFLDTYEGIQPIELPFLGLSLLLLFYVIYKFLTGSLKLENTLDYLFLLLHLLIPYAVILGKINGAATYTAFGEVTYFLGIFTYFPLREYLEDERFKKVLGYILIITLAFVLIRNFIYYRQILAQALLPWQAENARVAANELIVVIGCSLTLATASITESKRLQIISTGLFMVFLVSLVLTQSRGYWVAGFMSVIVIFLVVNKKGKLRIILTAFSLLSIGFVLASILFVDLLDLILNALNERLKSIGSVSKDNSLQDRWLESKTVFNLILQNPIAGYGFGTEFTRKRLFFDFFIQTSFIHNGYLGAFFKFGILGFVSFLAVWFLIIKKSKKLYKITHKIFPLAIVGVVSGMLLVNNTSSQILIFEGVAFTTLAAAYLNTELKKID